jgi:uncharacterized membrane protein YbhN (UPF0104 family)
MHKRGWALARLFISLAVLTFVLLTIGLERIGRTLLQADAGPLLVALALFILGVIVRAVRWRALVTALNLSIPFSRLLYLYFVGSFFNAFLPTGFGGDVVRVLELARDAQAATITGTVVLDRLTGLLVLFAMCLVALPFSIGLLPAQLWWTVGALALGGVLAGALVLQGSWLRRLGGWLPGPLSLTGSGALARAYGAVTACGWRAVGTALLISVVFNTLLVLVNYLAGRAVGVELGLQYYFVFVPILSLALMAPVSIGGLGVREGIAAVLFTQVGVDQALAVAFSLLVYAINRATGLFGGLLYLLQNLADLRQGREESPVVAEGDEIG